MGLLSPPLYSADAYVCQFGFVHVCTEATCTGAQRTSSCPISGKSFRHHQVTSSYDKNDSKTFGNVQLIDGVSSQPLRKRNKPPSKRPKLTDSSLNLFERPKQVEEEVNQAEEEPEVVEEQVSSKPKRKFKRRSVEQKIRNIVYSLLYGSVRKDVNRRHEQEQQDKISHLWSKYRLQQLKEKGFLDLVGGMMLQSHYQTPAPFELIGSDYERENHYVQLILQVYEKVVQYGTTNSVHTQALASTPLFSTHAHVDVEAITLYVLYSMRLGQVYDGIEILPSDPYLKRYLPDVNDLGLFRLHRGKIKQGSKLVRDAYNNAMDNALVKKEDLTLKDAGFVPDDRVEMRKSVNRKRRK